MSETPPLAEQLASLAARVRTLAQGKAKAHPDARVRLAQPLESAPAAARVDLLLGLEPGLVAGPRPQPPFASTPQTFRDQIAECQLCPLGAKRKRMVYGEGDPNARLALVGAFPGGDDEQAGKPFAGAAGELLERMLAAMGFKRSDVYVCTVLKCRHHGAGDPLEADLEACRPFLRHELGLIGPAVVVALGQPAARALLRTREPLAALRGRWGDFDGLRTMPTYHPSDLLRDRELKRHVWDDLKLVLQDLGAHP